MPGRPALEGRVLVAAGITGAGLEAISGSGHRVEVEHPAEARPAVLSFPGGPP